MVPRRMNPLRTRIKKKETMCPRPRCRIEWLAHVPSRLRPRLIRDKVRLTRPVFAKFRTNWSNTRTRNISKTTNPSNRPLTTRSLFIGATRSLEDCSFVPSLWLCILSLRLGVLLIIGKRMNWDKKFTTRILWTSTLTSKRIRQRNSEIKGPALEKSGIKKQKEWIS